MTYNPRPETKEQLLRVWEAWLSPKSRWLKALRAASPDAVFHDWGMGLPGRSHGLLPFCMEATLNGQTVPISKVSDLEALK